MRWIRCLIPCSSPRRSSTSRHSYSSTSTLLRATTSNCIKRILSRLCCRLWRIPPSNLISPRAPSPKCRASWASSRSSRANATPTCSSGTCSRSCPIVDTGRAAPCQAASGRACKGCCSGRRSCSGGAIMMRGGVGGEWIEGVELREKRQITNGEKRRIIVVWNKLHRVKKSFLKVFIRGIWRAVRARVRELFLWDSRIRKGKVVIY